MELKDTKALWDVYRLEHLITTCNEYLTELQQYGYPDVDQVNYRVDKKNLSLRLAIDFLRFSEHYTNNKEKLESYIKEHELDLQSKEYLGRRFQTVQKLEPRIVEQTPIVEQFLKYFDTSNVPLLSELRPKPTDDEVFASTPIHDKPPKVPLVGEDGRSVRSINSRRGARGAARGAMSSRYQNSNAGSGRSNTSSAILRKAAAEKAATEARHKAIQESNRKEAELLKKQQQEQLKLKEQMVQENNSEARRKAGREVEEKESESRKELLSFRMSQADESANLERAAFRAEEDARIEAETAKAVDDAVRTSIDGSQGSVIIDESPKAYDKCEDYVNNLPTDNLADPDSNSPTSQSPPTSQPTPQIPVSQPPKTTQSVPTTSQSLPVSSSTTFSKPYSFQPKKTMPSPIYSATPAYNPYASVFQPYPTLLPTQSHPVGIMTTSPLLTQMSQPMPVSQVVPKSVSVSSNLVVNNVGEPGYGDMKHNLNDSSASIVEIGRLADIVAADRIGLSEKDYFDGKPGSNYFTFITQFHTLTKRLSDPSTKLSCLRRWTKDKANDAISHTVYREAHDPEGALSEALKALETRFGRTHKLMEQQINKLISGKPCSKEEDGSLDDLIKELRHAKESTRLIPGGLTELKSPYILRQIMHKRCPFLKSEWMKRSCKLETIEIDMFIGFLEEQSEMYSSAFGFASYCIEDGISRAQKQEKRPKENNQVQKNIPKPPKSSATLVKASAPTENKGKKSKSIKSEDETSLETAAATASPNKKKENQAVVSCIMCKDPHNLWKCPSFREKTTAERFQFTTLKKLCHICFGNHKSDTCQSKISCFYCKNRHNSLLHGMNFEVGAMNCSILDSAPSQASGSRPIVAVVLHCLVTGVKLRKWAMIDSGSDVSYVLEDTRKQLGAPAIPQMFNISSLENEGEAKIWSTTKFNISSVDGNFILPNVKAIVSNNLPVSTCVIPNKENLAKYSHLKSLEIHECKDDKVSMIIGVDEPSCWQIKESKVGRGRRDPVGWLTPFGWGIVGIDRNGSNESAFIQVNEMTEIHDQLKRMWVQDFNDVDGHRLGMSKQDRQALQAWEDSACYVIHQGKTHVQLALPWAEGKREDVKLPPLEKCQAMVEKRMKSLERRFRKNPHEFEMANEQINKYLKEGHARILPKDEVIAPDGCPQWILPHVLAYHPDKPDEVRLCMDAAAKVNGVSLNSKLLTGPDLMNKMIGVCLRFREFPVTIEADIKRMFHMVRLDPADCWAKCYYWWKDNKLENELELHQLLIQMFGAAPSPGASAFALRKVAKDNAHLYPEEIIAAIFWNFYVDDLQKSVMTSDKAIFIINKLIDLLRRGGFRLTKIRSNCPEVLDSVPPEERAEQPKGTIEKSLGIAYDRMQDQYYFDLSHLQKRPDPKTPRQCLSFNASPFDQFGQVSPAFLKSKKALQTILQHKYAWDDEIPDDLLKDIWKCKATVHILRNYTIPRCFMPLDMKFMPQSVYPVFFVDACEIGYGCVGYLILNFPNGVIHVAFLIGKSLVTPFKVPTIPRLELTSARTGIRVAQTVLPELTYPITRTFYFTDSQSTLRKLANETERFKTFDCNRLMEIHEYSKIEDWDFVRTKLNPADLVSRGIEAEDIDAWKFYHHGPNFIHLPQEQWPREQWDKKLTAEDLLEVKKECGGIQVCEAALIQKEEANLIDSFVKSSTWNSLVVSVAWFKRIVRYWHQRAIISLAKRSSAENESLQHACLVKTKITLSEFTSAEITIFQLVQQKHYGSLIKFLSTLDPNIRLKGEVTGQPDAMALRGDKKEVRAQVHKLSTNLQQLDPCLFENLLLVGGRLIHSSISFESRHQIILPGDDPYIQLLVEDLHVTHAHGGREYIFHKSRERFWLVGARRVINKVIQRCFKCRKMLQSPMSQQMAPLPNARITIGYPFQDVGVDYAGPFHIGIGRGRQQKVWICIFVCLRVRAVHIELVESLSSNSFIHAFIRFKNRKGQPLDVWSDNGSNFVGAEKELKEWLQEWKDSGEIENLEMRLKINWHWSAPLASHTSGHVESMIRPMRRILTAISDENKLQNREEMHTLLSEVEHILNHRPLTPVHAEPGMPNPITPAMLLFPHAETVTIPQGIPEGSSYHRKRWRTVQHLVSVFWKRWSREYLQYLQRRSKWHTPERVICVGDLVMMVSESKCRSEWPLASVVQIFPSSDSLVRKVLVRVASGKTYVRDLRKLVLLEQSQSFDDPVSVSNLPQECPVTVDELEENNVIHDEIDEPT